MTTKTKPTKTKPAGGELDFTRDGHVVFDLAEAKYAAGVALSAAGATSEATPVLVAGHFYADGDSCRVVATDRYRVHTAHLTPREISDGFRAVVPTRALRWIGTAAGYFGRNATLLDTVVRIEWQGSLVNAHGRPAPRVAITISDANEESITLHADGLGAKYPPVHRLFEKARTAEAVAAPTRLRPDFLSKLRHLSRERLYAPELKFTESGIPLKPGPVLVTFRTGGTVYAEALIQPNALDT